MARVYLQTETVNASSIPMLKVLHRVAVSRFATITRARRALTMVRRLK